MKFSYPNYGFAFDSDVMIDNYWKFSKESFWKLLRFTLIANTGFAGLKWLMDSTGIFWRVLCFFFFLIAVVYLLKTIIRFLYLILLNINYLIFKIILKPSK